ncbi:phosphoribosylglycinamide formyltransferase-1 [Paenibacillus shirakamiensis]|uniref:Phosphoribosylglycinamide formyltransferase n=1 Tax=Paenibacillus shirakamiensis TaxID=1265935 RepID=A0ABS4JIE0_9BACL|nr:phosphoribosylglycinamide formyltransferase [Paenibacillus shirakamiensis]MBP2000881.1 phosphoribosylglycinamide formyltransferase-1 [Paenibacillus shirakamiensis]
MGSYRIAVFASGQGSNFQALADAAARNELGGAEIVLLVCDKPMAPVVARAEQAGIEVFLFQPKDYPSREDYEREIAAELTKRSVDLIVLAGYMRLLTSVLVEPYAGQMINIHPSLLPAFPGVRAIEQAYNYGVKLTGATVHLVDGGMDTGPIIAQRTVTIEEGEGIASIEERIHGIEQCMYPKVVSWFAQGLIQIEGRKVTVLHAPSSKA